METFLQTKLWIFPVFETILYKIHLTYFWACLWTCQLNKVTQDLSCVCKQKKNSPHFVALFVNSFFHILWNFITAANWEAILLVTYAILASLVGESHWISRVKQPIRARENAFHRYNLSRKYCTSRHHSSGRLRKFQKKRTKHKRVRVTTGMNIDFFFPLIEREAPALLSRHRSLRVHNFFLFLLFYSKITNETNKCTHEKTDPYTETN